MHMKTVAMALATMLTVTSGAAYAGNWNFLDDQCAGSYTYMKGPKSSWPAWAQAEGCVRSWSENPMAAPSGFGKKSHAE
jgi:hypothetical protein